MKRLAWGLLLGLLVLPASGQQAVTIYDKNKHVIETANPLPVTSAGGSISIDQTDPGVTNGVFVNGGSLDIGNGYTIPSNGSPYDGASGAYQALAAGCNAKSGLPSVVNGTIASLYCDTSGRLLTVPTPQANTTTTLGTTVTTHAVFQTALASSTSRKGCLITNTSNDKEFVFFGANGSATTAASLPLGPGASVSCAAGLIVLSDNIAITSNALDGATYVIYSQ